jgi:hypothetical protein
MVIEKPQDLMERPRNIADSRSSIAILECDFSNQGLLPVRAQQRDGCLSLPYYLPNTPLQLRWRPLHLGGIAPADGQSVSRRRLRFISENRAGSLPGKIRSPTSRQVPSLITAV